MRSRIPVDRRLRLAPSLLALALLGASEGPPSPESEARSIRLAPGLRLEPVAAEPLVVSPSAIAFDGRGRLFVAENRGYPTTPGLGRVALLEDSDGDGRMDRRSEFADGLSFPNGVLPWRDGVLVTCAPDLLYLADLDGDGRADRREVLFTGFSTSGSTQLRASHPTLSIDNWIYVAGGLTGGKVTAPAAPGRPAVEFGRADFRFRPDTAECEVADGGAQFGLTFDDFGRRFFCYNRVQVQHAAIDSATLRRNPHLATSGTVQDCPAEFAPEFLKGHGRAARLRPISRNVTTADSHAGTFTAACGVTAWRGTGLPDSYRGGAFSCDPTGNLVHFDRLEPAGATFRAAPMEGPAEFLASLDDWTRPVFLASGPDGALYVVDMPRGTIEHPDYLPDEVRKRTDFEAGKGLGRIWRVVRDDLSPDAARALRRVDLDAAPTVDLVATLRSPDGWRRDTAHRILLQRRDRAAVGPLRDLAADPGAAPASAVHALRLLEALGGLEPPMVLGALGHPSAPVRETALQLPGPGLADDPARLAATMKLADDPDARVRFRAAIALGSAPTGDRAAAEALARVASRDGADRWARAAALSSLSGREGAFLAALDPSSMAPELAEELGRLMAASLPRPAWPEALRVVTGWGGGPAEAARSAFLAGFAGAARGRLGPAEGRDVFGAAAGPDPAGADLLRSIRRDLEAGGRAAADPSRPIEGRRAAVALLAHAGFEAASGPLLGLLSPGEPPALQAAAARALGSIVDDRVAPALLDPARFAGYAPSTRDEVLAAVCSRPDHLPGLLAALESGRVPPGAVDALRRRQLAQHGDPEVRRRAGAIFGAVAGDRARVFEAYKGVIDGPSDPANGRSVFRRECASCHRLDREGAAVGPDLFDVRGQAKAAILLHVLAPDHEITPGFAGFTVAMKDGRSLTGLIASETPTSLTLRLPLGREESALREQVEAISAASGSLMPTGLENNITRREFADLLAYLKGEGAP